MLELSEDQNIALKKLMEWYSSGLRSKYLTLGGFAGTGKTTLISVFRNELRKKNIDKKDKDFKVIFCSYTGKATRVLEQKLRAHDGIRGQDEIGTIHSIMYNPRLDKHDQIVGWNMKEELEADLIIVDEASMVNENIWNDLLSYGIPIVAVGDHAQLPPIEGRFNLMERPQIILEKIHRQASDNPIIAISLYARQNGQIPAMKFADKIFKVTRDSPEYGDLVTDSLENYNYETLVLCGFNLTRIRLNKYLRGAMGYNANEPEFLDRVICLKNNYQKKIYNGMLGSIDTITKLDENAYFVNLDMDGEKHKFKGSISAKAFNLDPKELEKELPIIRKNHLDIFDFGYAMTVHKAQGSQAKKVILFEERFRQMDEATWKKWLYTAVTRASDELVIFGQ